MTFRVVDDRRRLRACGLLQLVTAMNISAVVHRIFVLASSATLAGLLEVLETIFESIILQRSVCLLALLRLGTAFGCKRRRSLDDSHCNEHGISESAFRTADWSADRQQAAHFVLEIVPFG